MTSPSPDVAEIVARLRKLGDPRNGYGPSRKLYREAADALDRMKAELDVKSELATAHFNSLNACEDALAAERESNARLREALAEALHKMWEYGFSENDLQPIRAALSADGGRTAETGGEKP